VANSAIRVAGRLDSAEANRGEYGFLPPVQRQRATIVKPGTMLVSQPELPIPLVVQFPFPSWATRASEAATGMAGGGSAAGSGAGDATGNGHTNGNGHGPTGVTAPPSSDPFAGIPSG
jgi:hypothetical protein